MRAGLSIGDLSQLTHLSVKTLRRYHEAGLLQPASPPIKIELRTAEAITTAAIRATVDHSELLNLTSRLDT
jgi:hypothetical protein